jgi:PiT family inorganic phosphate transporter
MTEVMWFVYVVIAIAFIFDFINGFHDAPNSIATIVATGVLKPVTAVFWAAFFNFIAFLFFHLKVADTVGAGLVDPSFVNPYMIFSALIGAITFSLFTWYFGLPSSSSHSLIGGLLGAALMKGGTAALHYAGIFKVLAFIVLSPVIGFAVAFSVMHLLSIFVKNPESARAIKYSRIFQLIASAFVSLGHGGNDAQKTMGVIAVVMFSAGMLGPTFHVPFWVVISCNLVMGLGTLFGGWRIVHTLGHKITKLTPMSGGCASTGAAVTLMVANHYGIPVSTTHTITGSIIGVGNARGGNGTNWAILKRIVTAWIFTIPCAGLIAAGVSLIVSHFAG